MVAYRVGERAWRSLPLPGHMHARVFRGGYNVAMKPTPSAQDKRRAHAKETDAPQHPGADGGARPAIKTANVPRRYTLPDLRVGNPTAADPLARRSWAELRELIYGSSS